MTHTPTPWRYPGLGVQGGLIWGGTLPVPIALAFSDRVITPAEAEANAEFIVRAVNAYDELVETLQVILDNWKYLHVRGDDSQYRQRITDVLAKAQALMEKEV